MNDQVKKKKETSNNGTSKGNDKKNSKIVSKNTNNKKKENKTIQAEKNNKKVEKKSQVTKKVSAKKDEKEISSTTKKISNDKQNNQSSKKSFKKLSKKHKYLMEIIFLLVSTCLISLLMGWYVCYKMQYRDSIVAHDRYLKEFVDNYQNVKENYYKEVDWRKALDNSMEGLLESLDDDYAGIIKGDEVNKYNSKIEGEYQGLGMEIATINNRIHVVSVFRNSNAEKAGIKVDDIILKVDNVDLVGKSNEALTEYVANASENVKLTILRNDNEQIISVDKGSVIIPNVESEMIEQNNKKIGYINIGYFSKVDYESTKKQLAELEKNNMDSLIIDLRSNSGGSLEAVHNIASLFLDSSKVVYQIKTKNETTKFYSKGNETKKYPIVVLQNGDSASGSEILSSALKEQLKATVIGTKSFGKGTVQELYLLKNGNEYKFTTEKWLTSKGRWIDKVGINPTIEEAASSDYNREPTRENDNQLKRAIAFLTEE